MNDNLTWARFKRLFFVIAIGVTVAVALATLFTTVNYRHPWEDALEAAGVSLIFWTLGFLFCVALHWAWVSTTTVKTILLALAVLASASVAVAEYYKVCVTRVDDNLYRDQDSRVYIKTRFCFEFATLDNAVLKYEPYSYDNKLIFDSGTSCDVVAVFK